MQVEAAASGIHKAGVVNEVLTPQRPSAEATITQTHPEGEDRTHSMLAQLNTDPWPGRG